MREPTTKPGHVACVFEVTGKTRVEVYLPYAEFDELIRNDEPYVDPDMVRIDFLQVMNDAETVEAMLDDYVDPRTFKPAPKTKAKKRKAAR